MIKKKKSRKKFKSSKSLVLNLIFQLILDNAAKTAIVEKNKKKKKIIKKKRNFIEENIKKAFNPLSFKKMQNKRKLRH